MANKKAGKKSLAQNDFLQPSAPISVSASDVGTNRAYNDGAASVSFSLPAGSPAATSYTVTSSPGGYTASGSTSPITVTGLQSATDYTFTVTATNSAGTSSASAASSLITATTVPATMSAPSASSSTALQDVVSWSAPNSGGKAISLYRWTSSDNKTGTSTTTSVTVAQEGGTSQTYQVRAENANGVGVYSASSVNVTTVNPFFPFFPYFPYFPYFPSFAPPPSFPFFPSFGSCPPHHAAFGLCR